MSLWNDIDGLRAVSQTLIWIAVIGAVIAALAAFARHYVDRRAEALASLAQAAAAETARQQLAEAHAKVAALEKKTRGRAIPSDQREKFLVALRLCAQRKVAMLAISGDAEAAAFAKDLESVFKEGGWESEGVSEHQFLGLPIGLKLRVPDRNNVDPCTVRVQQAFDAVGIDAPADITGVPSDVLEIIVGQKPTFPP